VERAESRLRVQDVRLLDGFAIGVALAGIFVAIAMLSTGTERRAYLIAAGLGFAGMLLLNAPRTVWLDEGALHTRRLGRARAIRLEDVVKVRVIWTLKSPPCLFFERADATGLMLLRLDGSTAAFRGELGRQLVSLAASPKISAEARDYLGLE
jgi:hypothetical protein